MLKFLHVADLHLDRPFEGLTLLNSDFSKKMNLANEQVLNNIFRIAQTEQIDFLILAGDTFHQRTTSLKTQQVLENFFINLNQIGVPVFMIFGNHDYYQEDNFWFKFPDNVYIWPDEKVASYTFTTKNKKKVQLSGFSYNHRWLNEAKALDFPIKDSLNIDYHIGIYHGQEGYLSENDTHQYAPFTLNQLKAKNYDYWALGHIHIPQELDDQGRVIYAGTPQGHSRKETSVAGVVLVQLDKDKLDADWFSVDEVRYAKLIINLDAIESLSQAINKLNQEIQLEIQKYPEQQYILELELTVNHVFQEEIDKKITSGELQTLLSSTNGAHRVAISKVAIVKETEKAKKINLPLNQQQIKKELQNFTSPTKFSTINNELLDSPLFKEEVGLSETLLTDVTNHVLANVTRKLVMRGDVDAD